MRLLSAALAVAVLATPAAAKADAAACAGLRDRFDADQTVLATRWLDAEICLALGEDAAGGRFALALPEAWNERLMTLGCEGFCGRIDIDAATRWAERGYAALSYAGGHRSASTAHADWAHKNPAAERAWAGDGVVAAVTAAKRLVRLYHAEDLRFTYARGCGDAGRQALALAARAPDLVQGVLALAPVTDPGGQYGPVAAARADALYGPDGAPRLTAEDTETLSIGGKASCAEADDPVACALDPATLICGRREQGDLPCLSEDAAAAAAALYDDPMDSFGDPLAMGRLIPGGEAEWIDFGYTAAAPQDWLSRHEGYVRHMATEFEMGEAWRVADYDLDSDAHDGETARARYKVSPNDLSTFFSRGGRVVIAQGWADPSLSPAGVAAFADAAPASNLAAYFAHDVGGCDGLSIEAALTALETWVEVDEAPPESIEGAGGERFVKRGGE